MKHSNKQLTPRQASYMQAYTNPVSMTFGNSYQSARSAGYSDQFAKNLLHLKPDWLSTNIGQMVAIQPEELVQELATIIKSETEPTIIRLKAIELNLKAYGMLTQRQVPVQPSVTLNIDLSGSS